MNAKPDQIAQMQRYMMKLLIGIMTVAALTAAVPLYLLRRANMEAAVATAPLAPSENAALTR